MHLSPIGDTAPAIAVFDSFLRGGDTRQHVRTAYIAEQAVFFRETKR
jgi:hypothetical protein